MCTARDLQQRQKTCLRVKSLPGRRRQRIRIASLRHRSGALVFLMLISAQVSAKAVQITLTDFYSTRGNYAMVERPSIESERMGY